MKQDMKLVRSLIREEILSIFSETKLDWDWKNKDPFGVKQIDDKAKELVKKKAQATRDLTKTYISPYDVKVRFNVGDAIKSFIIDDETGKVTGSRSGKVITANSNSVSVRWLDSSEEEIYNTKEAQELVSDGVWKLTSNE